MTIRFLEDGAALEGYLREHLEGFRGPMALQQFRGGQSNPTFLLTTPEARYVLRKKPAGRLLPSAHQIEREYRVQHALRGTAVPVPEVFLLCQAETVIGTPFYIMEFIDGRVIHDTQLPGLVPRERAAVYDDLNRIAAALHSVDHRTIGLADFGQPRGYLTRQLTRWAQQYEASKVDDIAHMNELIRWLNGNIPEDQQTAVIHGDFRVGNAILHPREPRILAVLDWELSTLGHPLADFAYACMIWHMPSEAGLGHTGLCGLDLPALGLPDEASYIETYCRRTGRSDVSDWPFFLAFSFFRSAAIAQGVCARALRGNAVDPRSANAGAVAVAMAEIGWAIASSSGQYRMPAIDV